MINNKLNYDWIKLKTIMGIIMTMFKFKAEKFEPNKNVSVPKFFSGQFNLDFLIRSKINFWQKKIFAKMLIF